MSEEANQETPVKSQERGIIKNKRAFLKSSEMTTSIIDGLNLKGFQLGGGAVDFALGEYRRQHGDIDMVYVVKSRTWDEYVREPRITPKERLSLQNINQEPELYGVEQTTPIAMERVGAPGIQMQGGELPLVVDFIEAYRHTEDGEEYIMLPIYEGGSYIKIPSSKIIDSEIEGITTRVPTIEVQYLIKKQAAELKRTIKGGPPPDRRVKAKGDLLELRSKVNMNKVRTLELKGVGFNFTPTSSARFWASKLYKAISG